MGGKKDSNTGRHEKQHSNTGLNEKLHSNIVKHNYLNYPQKLDLMEPDILILCTWLYPQETGFKWKKMFEQRAFFFKNKLYIYIKN